MMDAIFLDISINLYVSSRVPLPADSSKLVDQLLFAQFSENAKLQMEKGNKAAGTRARKASLELEKLLKQFRKESLEASK